MRRVHAPTRRRSRAAAAIALLVLVAATTMLVGGSSAFAAGTSPSVSKDNDANHDSVYSTTENVPKNVTYPWVVTYRLTLNAGTFGSHKVAAISDDMTTQPDLGVVAPSCATLVGTTIAANTSRSATTTSRCAGVGCAAGQHSDDHMG